jgi:hypothetical protein
MKQLRFGIAALALALLASCGGSKTTETEIASDTSTIPAGTNDMSVMDTTITGTNTTNNGTGTTSGGTGGADTMMNR